MSEKLDAINRIREALYDVIPDMWEVTDEALLGYHELLIAFVLDIQNEWTRRAMMEEAKKL